MDIGLLLKGITIGFAIAAPVGPIGVLCIRRTLAEGRTSGFVSGLGAASADVIYGLRRARAYLRLGLPDGGRSLAPPHRRRVPYSLG